jgi:hypothetical protein
VLVVVERQRWSAVGGVRVGEEEEVGSKLEVGGGPTTDGLQQQLIVGASGDASGSTSVLGESRQLLARGIRIHQKSGGGAMVVVDVGGGGWRGGGARLLYHRTCMREQGILESRA